MEHSADTRGDLTCEQHLFRDGPCKAEIVFIPKFVDGSFNVAAMQYLACYREEPDNTRERMFDAISHLHVAAQLFGIEAFEHRLSYGSGLSRVELLALNRALKYQMKGLRKIADEQRSAFAILDVGRAVAAAPTLARTSEINRKLCAIKYLEWLMETGDAALTNYVVPEDKLHRRRQAFRDIRECIAVPKEPSGSRVSRFKPNHMARLKEAIMNYDPADIWKDPFTALRNSVMLDLMYYSTLRGGEVLGLYRSDIIHPRAGNLGEIRVEDRRDDPTDPRLPRPEAKTGNGNVTGIGSRPLRR